MKRGNMTRGKAVNEYVIPALKNTWNEKVCAEVINALEQEPCEDCISRKAVENITWEEPSYTDALNVLTEVREKVRELPSVTPQPKTGHWIHFAQSDDCSECRYSTGKYGSPSKYCPNCGAKMQEVEE